MAHAMEAHHNEVEPQTVEAVIVQIVDASLALARAPAVSRSSSTSNGCASWRRSPTRHDGVDKVYAMHAGREIRVIVEPDEIDDDAARCSRTRSRERWRSSSSTRARSR